MAGELRLDTRVIVDPTASAPRHFHKTEDGRYQLAMWHNRLLFELSRLRWHQHELWGQLAVAVDTEKLETVPTTNGHLHVADFNVSSASSRVTRARILSKLSRLPDIDWNARVEELCQRVLTAENIGQPIVRLCEVRRAERPKDFDVQGFLVPRKDIASLVADGGKGKSGFALWVAGELEQRGERILICDFETDEQVQVERAEQLFGTIPHGLFYRRCSSPLVVEADDIRRQIVDLQISYCVLDSIVPALHGPAEESAIAAALFRAERATGVGWLNIAHISKATEKGFERPFGSQFFFNESRIVWALTSLQTGNKLSLALHCRKRNNGALRPPVGFKFVFNGTHIDVSPSDPADAEPALPEPTDETYVWQRLVLELRKGPHFLADLAQRLGEDQNTIVQAVKRRPELFRKTIGADGRPLKPVRLELIPPPQPPQTQPTLGGLS